MLFNQLAILLVNVYLASGGYATHIPTGVLPMDADGDFHPQTLWPPYLQSLATPLLGSNNNHSLSTDTLMSSGPTQLKYIIHFSAKCDLANIRISVDFKLRLFESESSRESISVES